MCCYRDLKNFERFNFVIHSLIYLVVSKLKSIKQLIQNTNAFNDKILKNNIDESNKSSEDSDVPGEKPAEPKEEPAKPEDTPENVAQEPQEPSTSQENPVKSDSPPEEPKEEIWILPELEKLLIFISKIFLLNFPLYIAYKHGVHGSRIDDITQQEAQTLSMFCDIHDTEIPVFLYRNVTLFCTSGGFGAMAHCFELLDLPVSTAHACTVAISNIKLWLNYRSIIQLFVPLRIKVLQYMCKLSDQDLRSPATKSMAGEYNFDFCLLSNIFWEIREVTFLIYFHDFPATYLNFHKFLLSSLFLHQFPRFVWFYLNLLNFPPDFS